MDTVTRETTFSETMLLTGFYCKKKKVAPQRAKFFLLRVDHFSKRAWCTKGKQGVTKVVSVKAEKKNLPSVSFF